MLCIMLQHTISGGVDSSIVTAMLEESSIKIQRAMTITFNEKDRVALYAWKLFNKLKCKQLVRNVDIEEYYSSPSLYRTTL